MTTPGESGQFHFNIISLYTRCQLHFQSNHILHVLRILTIVLSHWLLCSDRTTYCHFWWHSIPVSGIGAGMVVVSSLVAIYYNMVIGWAIYYFVASFFKLPEDLNMLPWNNCTVGIGSDYCAEFMQVFDENNCTGIYTKQTNGVCVYSNGSMNSISGVSCQWDSMHCFHLVNILGVTLPWLFQ